MPTPPRPSPSLTDGELATSLVASAAAVLLELRASDVGASDPKELRAAGDAAAQAWLADALAAARPADAILSEEAADDPARLSAPRVWIIDPLDGTREFGERDDAGIWRDDFAVHVALWEQDRGLTHGAVSLPARNVMYSTDAPTSVRQDATGDVLDGRRPLRIAVSRSRPPEIVTVLAQDPGVELIPMGSAGVKTTSVLSGESDAYLHAGGQYEWDSAAPVAVVTAAGFIATRLDGSPLMYNQPNPWLPDLLVCHPMLHERVRGMLEPILTSEIAPA